MLVALFFLKVWLHLDYDMNSALVLNAFQSFIEAQTSEVQISKLYWIGCAGLVLVFSHTID
jgi:hypothetical protein